MMKYLIPPISNEEIQFAVSSLCSGKSHRPDMLLPEVLAHLGQRPMWAYVVAKSPCFRASLTFQSKTGHVDQSEAEI